MTQLKLPTHFLADACDVLETGKVTTVSLYTEVVHWGVLLAYIHTDYTVEGSDTVYRVCSHTRNPATAFSDSRRSLGLVAAPHAARRVPHTPSTRPTSMPRRSARRRQSAPDRQDPASGAREARTTCHDGVDGVLRGRASDPGLATPDPGPPIRTAEALSRSLSSLSAPRLVVSAQPRGLISASPPSMSSRRTPRRKRAASAAAAPPTPPAAARARSTRPCHRWRR